jgi:hypothetical protein
VGNFRPLKVGKHLQHVREKHENVFLRKGGGALPEISFKIGEAFLHLDVSLLARDDAAPLLLQDVAAPILDDVWMRVGSDLAKQLNFFSEDELGLFVAEQHFLDAFDAALLVLHLVDYAVASADHLPHLEALPELSLAA